MKTNGKLPPGWRRVRLGDVAAINPRRPPRIPYPLDTPTTFVPMASVKENAGGIEPLQLRPLDQVSKGYTYFEERDVLFAKITPCMQNGKHAIARRLNNGFGFGTTEFHVIRPGDGLLSEWVHFFIRQPSVLRNAAKQFRGAVGQQRVPKEFLANLLIPLPPLDEQKRIVAHLNEQMAVAEKARKAAEELLDAARALPNAFLQEALPKKGQPLPRGWRWVPLGDLMPSSTGTVDPRRHASEVFALYSIPACEEGAPQMLSGSLIGSSKQHVQHRDVLLSRIVPHIRRSWIVGSHEERTIASTEWIVFRTTNALPEYLRFVLISDDFHHQLMNTVSGVGGSLLRARPSLVAEIRISLPPLSEQKRIATMLLEQMAAAEEVRLAADTALADLRAMPSALLRRALAGAC